MDRVSLHYAVSLKDVRLFTKIKVKDWSWKFSYAKLRMEIITQTEQWTELDYCKWLFDKSFENTL